MGSKLYVGNLSFDTTDQELGQAFSEHGEIASALVVKDKYTDKSRGFGFVEFRSDKVVDLVLDCKPHEIDKKIVDVKRAVTKGAEVPTNVREPPSQDRGREREMNNYEDSRMREANSYEDGRVREMNGYEESRAREVSVN